MVELLRHRREDRLGELYVMSNPDRHYNVDYHAGSSPAHATITYSGVEQMAARVAHNHEVTGSSPVSATIKSQDETIVQLKVSL